jgi:hypothetical protein
MERSCQGRRQREGGARQVFVQLQDSSELIKLSEMLSVDAAPRGKAIDDQLRGLRFFLALRLGSIWKVIAFDQLWEIGKLEEAVGKGGSKRDLIENSDLPSMAQYLADPWPIPGCITSIIPHLFPFMDSLPSKFSIGWAMGRIHQRSK